MLTETANREVFERASRRRLGSRFREPPDGCLLGDDPQPPAALSHRGPGSFRPRGGDHRGRRRGDRAHRESVFRRAFRSMAQAQVDHGFRLWPRGALQAALRAGDGAGARVRGTLPGPHRQGNSRRTARRAHRRPHSGRYARRSIRPAPVAGHGGRLRRAAPRDGADARLERRFPCGVLGGGDSRPALLRIDVLRGARTCDVRRASREGALRARAREKTGHRILDGHGRRRRADAGSFQRSIPHPSRDGPGTCRGDGAARAGRNERRVFAHCLPRGPAGRSHRAARAAVRGHRDAHGGRRGARRGARHGDARSGVALWGLHMGFTQGLLSAMVAQAAPATLRGTAFGAFNLASGIAMLAASALAGALWQFVGPAATFWGGAALAGISAVLALSTLKSRRTA
jgi:hypothetical protein